MSIESRSQADPGADRRAFLAAAGKYAVVVPPAMTLLLSTTMTSSAIADSGKGAEASDPDIRPQASGATG
jgi:hypothetical protein